MKVTLEINYHGYKHRTIFMKPYQWWIRLWHGGNTACDTYGIGILGLQIMLEFPKVEGEGK